MVTHDAYAASYCSRVLYIKDGQLFTELIKGKNTQGFFPKGVRCSVGTFWGME